MQPSTEIPAIDISQALSHEHDYCLHAYKDVVHTIQIRRINLQSSLGDWMKPETDLKPASAPIVDSSEAQTETIGHARLNFISTNDVFEF